MGFFKFLRISGTYVYLISLQIKDFMLMHLRTVQMVQEKLGQKISPITRPKCLVYIPVYTGVLTKTSIKLASEGQQWCLVFNLTFNLVGLLS